MTCFVYEKKTDYIFNCIRLRKASRLIKMSVLQMIFIVLFLQQKNEIITDRFFVRMNFRYFVINMRKKFEMLKNIAS